ncbi:hypothetical protein I3W98_40885, partial [Streptomyces cavourensis]|nr:hypothetical protein [Streptomyces cavourensis]
MEPPEFPPLPALTRAEGEFIDCYLAVLDQVGRINPARGSDTYSALRAAQALASGAAALRDALALMHERGERLKLLTALKQICNHPAQYL